jgi:hypothetical protein
MATTAAIGASAGTHDGCQVRARIAIGEQVRNQRNMKREAIIAGTLRNYERTCVIDTVFAATFAAEQGQAALNDVLERHRAYPAIITDELERRLTDHEYLTCTSFDHLDVNCCASCHTGYPHYDMYDVTLDDGRHAWVCCPIRNILMRRVKTEGNPNEERPVKIFEEILGGAPDPVVDRLNAANLAAKTDEDHLRYCLTYAHHVYGRKRGHKTLETLVNRALRLPGCGPAKNSKLAGGEATTQSAEPSPAQ